MVTIIRCSNSKCNKVVGEIEHGKARFKCKHCGTYTTSEVIHTQRAPQISERIRTSVIR
jgi:transposase-like protein